MAIKRLIHITGLYVLSLLLNSCGPSLYFATNESHMINRLERAGNIQVEVNAQVEARRQQIYQAEMAVAVAPNVAIRGGMLNGGNLTWGDQKWGTVNARSLALGSFYKFGKSENHGSTWLGYTQGQASNENVRYQYDPNSSQRVQIAFFNDYERIYIEQQLRYNVDGIEFFGALIIGRSRVLNLRYEGVLPPNNPYHSRYNSQIDQPQGYFGIFSVGASGGSPNLRVHIRVDQWYGFAAQQISFMYPTFLSTGFNWRIQAKPKRNHKQQSGT